MELLTLDNLVTLGMLTLLQAVLGFDNLLYITLESKRAPAHRQAAVRRLGIGLAMVAAVKGYRIVLVMAEDMSEERKALMCAFGAELVLTPAAQGTKGAIEEAKRLAREQRGLAYAAGSSSGSSCIADRVDSKAASSEAHPSQDSRCPSIWSS
mgnify:CR=1 FL=1